MDEIKDKIRQFEERLVLLIQKLKIEEKKTEIEQLEKEVSSPGLWNDPKTAQEKTKQLSWNKDEIKKIEDFQTRLSSLVEVARSAESEILLDDLKKEADSMERELSKIELVSYLSEKYDSASAIVSIHAGQGGTEAMDWAQMLQRMYMRFAEKRGWRVDVIDIISGDEAGIKSVTLLIEGPYVYGYLKREKGTHRLVRQSPFNADKLRQTSFALVEVLPQIEESNEINIPDADLEWDFFRASSHGGQNVQKVSTAVRLKHRPTGIIVSSQSERYQERNRKIALDMLRAKLWEIEEEHRLKEKKELRGEFKVASWGNQIRSYVLHPYKMVKDLRTDIEVNDPFSVLDGELDEFIEAELKTI